MRYEIRSGLRVAVFGAFALAVGACTSMPELNEVKLVPEMRSFLPSNSNTYSNVTAMRSLKPAGPEDLVDAQGMCAGAPVAAAEPGATATDATAGGQFQLARPVALEMTECDVARALGPPVRAEFGNNDRGERSAVLTYNESDRAGIYRFAAGRLVSIERSPEAAAPKPEKKPTKKAAPAKKPARPAA
jgi:hypothetical protein